MTKMGAEKTTKLLVFDTHPIQYRSPVFRQLFQKHPGLKVVFFDSAFDGDRWWFHETGKIPEQNFAVSLTDGFPQETLSLRPLSFSAKKKRLESILEEENPKAVLIYGYYQVEHWILRWLCQKKNISLLFVGESFDVHGSALRRLIRTPLRNYFFSGVSQFLSIGKKTEAHYKSLHIDETRLTPAKYCTDVSFFELSPEESKKEREKTRKELDIPQEAFVVLFVGRLFDRKRPLDMLSLHSRLKDRKDFHTIIAGNGVMEKEVRRASEKFERAHYVGFQNQARLRSFYHAVDLLVVPSVYETWGLVINEAFAAGTPALVTDQCGAAGDLVVEGETGFVYSVGNMNEAEKKVRALLASPELQKSLRKSAKDRVSEEYNVEKFADAIWLAVERANAKGL